MIRGEFFDLVDDPWKSVGQEQNGARFLPIGLLVFKNGLSADFGPYAKIAPRHQQAEIAHLPNRLILLGFIDGHVHFPQAPPLGAYRNQSLNWLRTTFLAEESK